MASSKNGGAAAAAKHLAASILGPRRHRPEASRNSHPATPSVSPPSTEPDVAVVRSAGRRGVPRCRTVVQAGHA